MMKQLELFEAPRDYIKEIDDLRAEMSKLRKALFSQQADLRKQYQEIAHEHQIIKLNLCKGRLIA